MNETKYEHEQPSGTITHPRYFEGLSDSTAGVFQHRRYFSYSARGGLMAGSATSVMFTIDAQARDVWKYFKDFNLWQNSRHHYYSGAPGDLEGQIVGLVVGDPADAQRHRTDYLVVRVIPEYLIVMSQPGTDAGRVNGVGGYLVFMLNEHQSKTTVSVMMQHDRWTKETDEKQALAFWSSLAEQLLAKWRDDFVPTLKALVHESR